MKKHPLTSSGIDNLQAALHMLDDTKLQAEAELLAEDPRGWIAAHIEMPVHQFEFFRDLKDSFVLLLGWNLAIALLSRRPVNFTVMNDCMKTGNCKDACILLHSQFYHHLVAGTISATGQLNVQM